MHCWNPLKALKGVLKKSFDYKKYAEQKVYFEQNVHNRQKLGFSLHNKRDPLWVRIKSKAIDFKINLEALISYFN